jgi:hypothetical protein
VIAKHRVTTQQSCAAIDIANHRLRALSLNKNGITSLLGLIGFATMKFPQLTLLSLLRNPCSKSILLQHTAAEVAKSVDFQFL